MTTLRKNQSKENLKIKKIEAWVSFIDLYGFSALLGPENIDGSIKNLATIHEKLKTRFSETEYPKDGDFQYYLFSDSIVFWSGAPKGDIKAFRRMAEFCAIASRTSAEYGFLTRGCCAYGEISVGRNFVLGYPYIQAYRAESRGVGRAQIIVLASSLRDGGVEKYFLNDLKNVRFKDGSWHKAAIIGSIPWSQKKKIKIRNIGLLSQAHSEADNESRRKAIDDLIDIWGRQ